MKKYIGVLDSGVGGLSVLSKLVEKMPKNNFIYFGDTKNIPYGVKKPCEIFQFTKNILDFFLTKNVENVVFACNTTSAVAYDELRKCFEGKLNIFPLIQTAAPFAVQGLKNGDTIAVLATRATINSKKYEIEIKKHNPNLNVVSLDCTGFVEIVEQRLYDDKKSLDLIKSKLDLIRNQNVARAILGCTHYPYLVPIFKNILDVEYFDPALCAAEVVQKNVSKEGEGEILFFASKSPEEFVLSAKTFFDVNSVEFVQIEKQNCKY